MSRKQSLPWIYSSSLGIYGKLRRSKRTIAIFRRRRRRSSGKRAVAGSVLPPFPTAMAQDRKVVVVGAGGQFLLDHEFDKQEKSDFARPRRWPHVSHSNRKSECNCGSDWLDERIVPRSQKLQSPHCRKGFAARQGLASVRVALGREFHSSSRVRSRGPWRRSIRSLMLSYVTIYREQTGVLLSILKIALQPNEHVIGNERRCKSNLLSLSHMRRNRPSCLSNDSCRRCVSRAQADTVSPHQCTTVRADSDGASDEVARETVRRY